jgi:chemotaxis protein histidine kinase CheA
MDPARLPEGIPEQVLLDLFHRSGTDTLERARSALRRWADSGSEPDLADSRRLAHNLKGSSCQLGFEEFSGLAAALEAMLSAFLRGQRQATSAAIVLAEEAINLLVAALEAIVAGKETPGLAEMTTRLGEPPQ